MPGERGDLRIEFDVRDLLAEIRTDVKAIRSEQAVTSERLTRVEGRVSTIEEVSKSKTALIAAVITLIVMLAAVGGLLLRIGGH